MSGDPFEGLVGSREHRHGYVDPATGSPVPRAAEQAEPGENEYMFFEDIQQCVLPYGLGANEGFSIGVDPPSEDVTNLVRDALPIHDYQYWRLEDAFRNYIENALWFLVQRNLCLVIEYFRSTDDIASRPVAFRIEFLHSAFLTKMLGKYQYRVPTKGDKDIRWSSETIDPNCLIVVSVPRGLRRELNRTLRVIRAADQDLRVLSDFTTGKYGGTSGFDLKTYQHMSHDIVLRESRKTGWAGRGLLTEDLLDPEKVWRAIQFARLVVTLREIGLRGLQRAIDRAGVEIGFTAKLKLSRVLTFDDLGRMERDLKAGTRPLGDMFVPKPLD
jgi:hypothetical protein